MYFTLIVDRVRWREQGYYSALTDGATEDELQTRFPSGVWDKDSKFVEELTLDAPATILDLENKVLAWYLPKVISLRTMVGE